MTEIEAAAWRRLINERLGLRIGKKEDTTLRRTIHERVSVTGLVEAANYLDFLSKETPASELEWETLAGRLTINETYFFRDARQFDVFRTILVPQRIRERQREKTLRIWSAGCSTGEELYSIAILLDLHIPELADWNVTLLGTDVNPENVRRARDGRYREWSFRGVDARVREQYFQGDGKEWRVIDRIRKRVRFEVSNLVADAIPDPLNEIHSMDVILCRNVFIYFDSATVRTVAERMIRTLMPGGYLVTGHAELYAQLLDGIDTIHHPGSLVYQREMPLLAGSTRVAKPVERRSEEPKPSRDVVVRPQPKSNAKPRVVAEPTLTEAQGLAARGSYRAAVELVEPLLKNPTPPFEAHYLLAECYAHLGRREDAAAQCKRALERDPLSAKTYFLLAKIAEDADDQGNARTYLEKVLYLDAAFTGAYIDLGSALKRSGETTRALRLWETATGLLSSPLRDGKVPGYPDASPAEALSHVQRLIQQTTGSGESRRST
ncbi:MAG: tetratricopeptide repeat protein [Candidatus Poribacteria bacterium]|nr:tetratricopeptide repeat protein [Candidatus Poribacteria bacterium]